MSNNALINNTETLLGGWTLYHTPTPEDLQIFRKNRLREREILFTYKIE